MGDGPAICRKCREHPGGCRHPLRGSLRLVSTRREIRALHHSLGNTRHSFQIPDWGLGLISAAVPTLLGFLAKRRDGTQRRWAKWLFLLSGPLFFLITFTIIASHLRVGARQDNLTHWAVASFILLVWVFLALNVNTFAPHRYYRDRLCECYLAVP